MPTTDTLVELETALGAGAVLRPAAPGAGDDLERYLRPWRGERGDTSAVLRPADVEQVRTVVGWARHHGVRLVPQGANTGLVGASTPPTGSDAVVLSTERLHGAALVDPVDRTAVVPAGVRLSELNDAAAVHGLSLPIDLGADPTLGGMVATNTGGSRMLRHGDLRRSLLGVRAVIADEGCSVVDELHTLRKHNVGPALTHLLVGAGGSLGVVTDVAVELTPMPAERACAWIAPTRDELLVEVVGRLEHEHGDVLSAFEVVSSNALSAALALPGAPPDPLARVDAAEGHVALVELSGREGTAELLPDALAGLHRRGLIADAVVVPTAAAWSLRHSITEGLARRGTVLGFDVSVPRPSLPELVAVVAEQLPAVLPGAELADFGHWGDGGVHCNVVLAGTPPTAEQRGAVRELVLGLVVDRFGGSFSAEHGVGPVNADWWRRATPPATRALLRSIAELVDPLDVLGHPGLPFRRG